MLLVVVGVQRRYHHTNKQKAMVVLWTMDEHALIETKKKIKVIPVDLSIIKCRELGAPTR